MTSYTSVLMRCLHLQVANNEDYFIHNDGSVALTSDHTLNKLSVPRLSGETLRTIIGDGVLADHKEEREALYLSLIHI